MRTRLKRIILSLPSTWPCVSNVVRRFAGIVGRSSFANRRRLCELQLKIDVYGSASIRVLPPSASSMLLRNSSKFSRHVSKSG
jgi:hypothetical protein